MIVLAYVIGALVILAGIAISIGLHELGHLIPAKLFGLRVPRYMIGFGPTIFSRKIGETEYGFKLLPLGGYISMVGMFPPARQGGRQRASRTGILQQLSDEARRAEAETLQPGDENRLFLGLPAWKRIVIMLGGPFMNLILAFVFFSIVLVGFGQATPTTQVSEVFRCIQTQQQAQQAPGQDTCPQGAPAGPAYDAGLRPGDIVTSVNGQRLGETDWDVLTQAIKDSPDKPVRVTYLRAGAEHSTTLTPVMTARPVTDALGVPKRSADGTTETAQVGFAGIGSTTQTVPQPITAVPGFVGQNLQAVGKVVVDLPARMVGVVRAAFGTEPRDPNGPVSVVGVGRLAGEVTAMDQVSVKDKIATYLGMVGSLNVALFVFNLIPLTPLDGGHVAGALWEKLRQGFNRLRGRRDSRPVDMAKMLPVTYAVAGLLLVMGALLIYADIVKPVTLSG